MLHKNIQKLPAHVGDYIRQAIALTKDLEHFYKLVEAAAMVSKENQEAEYVITDELSHLAQQIMPKNAEILICTDNQMLARVLVFSTQEPNLFEDAFKQLDEEQKLDFILMIQGFNE
jgi:hypothetical protein